MPQPAKVVFGDQKDCVFEYQIGIVNGAISLHSRLRFKRATFGVEEYAGLRNFYELVVKKQAEKIVFKKNN